MKFTCTKNNFNNGINIALKAVPGKTTMPILECVVIEAKDESIKLTTNDMQLGIETKIPATVQEEGIILVNAKMIADIVRRLPDEDVKAEEKSEEKTEMKTENIEAVRDPEVTGVQEETLNTGDATISDDVVTDETDNHVSDSEE